MSRKFTIGRERTCDVLIADESVSRVHGEIWLADEGFIMLADHNSTNGTTLIRGGQSRPLKTEALLPGDQVKMGAATLSLKELIDAVEGKHPGALTPAPRPVAAPPPTPPLAPRPVAAAPPPAMPPPFLQQPVAMSAPPPLPMGNVVRCECGSMKVTGQPCATCQRP